MEDISIEEALAQIEQISVSRELIEIIKKSFESDFIYGFEEIRNHDKMSLLSPPERQLVLNTLELFSFGTIRDYHQNRELFMPLSERELVKLQRLTLISSICSNTTDFGTLKATLGIESTFDLEVFLIGSVELKIIDIKISNIEECIKINKIIQSRDILVGSNLSMNFLNVTTISELSGNLNSWIDDGLKSSYHSFNEIENLIGKSNNNKKRKQSEDEI